jgi:hypothetical protein
MQQKFKVGDKVVRKEISEFGLEIGEVYVVKATDGAFVIVQGNGWQHCQHAFDLYQPALKEQISDLEKQLEALKKQHADEEAAKAVTYRMGQRFKETDLNAEYILAQVDYNLISLINVQSGNYYRKAVVVNDRYKITTEEFQKITGDNPFIPIN